MGNRDIGNGTILKVSTSTTVSSSNATTVGGILSWDGPSGDAADVDLMTLDSTSNDVPYAKGFGTAGDMSFEVAYDQADSGWAKIKAMRAATTIGNFLFTHPSTDIADETVKGYVKSVGRTIQRDQMITRPITVHASSGPGFN